MIDLRSDTVTKPDAAMRRAMAEAEVGDDVYGEDPTVRRLEGESAAAMGCAAAIFVPSGTMGNQVALRVHARSGSEVICEAASHVVQYEVAAMAGLSGLMPRALTARHGLLEPEAVAGAMAPDDSHRARTGLLVIENTHNMSGGRIYDRARLDALLGVARRHGVPVHLDGARIWNAAIALGVPPSELVAGFDSVMFCLSKGLGAPVGSMLCGSADFIAEAWRVRKMFGGGMRQVGVLAAAGLVALHDGPERLATDHFHAGILAQAIAEVPGLEIMVDEVVTNIVVFRVTPGFFEGTVMAADLATAFLERLRGVGVLGGTAIETDQVRLVTHRDVGRQAIDRVAERLAAMGNRGG